MTDLHYMYKRIKVKKTSKTTYIDEGIVGKEGRVVALYEDNIGVEIDWKINYSSASGIYWFKEDEVEIIEENLEQEEKEMMKMKKFDKLAVVTFMNDNYDREYAFAIYDEELELINSSNTLLVVNPCETDNRVLAKLSYITTLEEFYADKKNTNIKITAQVVGVVNMEAFTRREEEERRRIELAKKKALVVKQLEDEINKIKSLEYYEEVAERYADNKVISDLVNLLKDLQ